MSLENVLLFGLGGIGGVYASILHLGGKCNVHVVARSNYDSVKNNGFRLKSPIFGDHDALKFAGVWKTTEDAAKAGVKFSYVLCANKALLDATPSLSDHLRPVISPETSIVLLQNGVGAEDPLHASFPNTTIISAVVWTGGRTLAAADGLPAGAEQFNREGLTIGVDYKSGSSSSSTTRAAERAKLETIVEWFKAGKGSPVITDDIQSERWIKVIWNCCWNAITTVVRCRTNVFFESSDDALPLCYAIMREVEAVAKAKGLTVPDGTVERLIKQCTDVDGLGLPSSMMADNFAARPMEVEVILGTPVKEGKRLGVPTPTLMALYVMVKALDYGNAHPEKKVDGK